MKKQKIQKFLVFILTLCIMIFNCYYIVEAGETGNAGAAGEEPYTGTVAGIGTVGQFTGNNNGTALPDSLVGMILSAIRITAGGSAAIAITVMGINYMVAAPTERAEIKNQMIRFAIGIILVVAATEIVVALKDVAGKVKAP